MITKINKKILFKEKISVEIEKSDELKNQVEDNWNNFVQGKTGYFNGDIFVITNKEEKEDIVYEVGKAKYADLVYAKNHKDLTILSLFASILFKTKDNYYVFIQNSHDRVNVIGGLASEEDFENGFFVPEKCLGREVREEINLNINNKNDVIDYEMKFITGPSNNENVFPFGIVFTGTLNYTKEELEDYFINNKLNFDSEIKQLLFFTKDNYLELNNIDNKEPYLMDLMNNIGE